MTGYEICSIGQTRLEMTCTNQEGLIILEGVEDCLTGSLVGHLTFRQRCNRDITVRTTRVKSSFDIGDL